ncbi:MAG TPA: hypothetical protein VFM49_16370 [Chloroflexia bacterium]|nr:hypothetical protein [Chloroflexia bacterium]
MPDPNTRPARWLDVAVLLVAGLVNSVLAPADAALVLAPGTPAQGGDLAARMAWVAAHAGQWQAGWAFWFVVTTTFAGSYYALTRHLGGPPQWRALAIALALLAAALDLAGVVIHLAVLPQLAAIAPGPAPSAGALTYLGFETLANALTNVAAFGLYTGAGLLLLPVLFATPAYPRPLAWLGAAEWAAAALATVLLALAPAAATGPLLLSFLLYAPWVWGSAWCIAQAGRRAS